MPKLETRIASAIADMEDYKYAFYGNEDTDFDNDYDNKYAVGSVFFPGGIAGIQRGKFSRNRCFFS